MPAAAKRVAQALGSSDLSRRTTAMAFGHHRALEIEAPSLEVAELHASLLMRALKRAGN